MPPTPFSDFTESVEPKSRNYFASMTTDPDAKKSNALSRSPTSVRISASMRRADPPDHPEKNRILHQRRHLPNVAMSGVDKRGTDSKMTKRTVKSMDPSFNDDPPDRLEESNIAKTRRQQSFRQQTGGASKAQTCQLPTPTPNNIHPQQYSQTETQNESSKSLSPQRDTTLNAPSKPKHRAVTPTRRKSTSPGRPRRPPGAAQSRRLSPHPVQIFKGHAAEKQHKDKAKTNTRVKLDAPTSDDDDMGSIVPVSNEVIVSPSSSPLRSDISYLSFVGPQPATSFPCVDFDSRENAEQLRRLIEAMQNEFERLRSAKIQAESKVEKLQTDLANMQQEMEAEFINLSTENERLRNEASEREINLEQATAKASNYEMENRSMKIQLSKLRNAKNSIESKLSSVEEENRTIKKTMHIFMGERYEEQRSREKPLPTRRNSRRGEAATERTAKFTRKLSKTAPEGSERLIGLLKKSSRQELHDSLSSISSNDPTHENSDQSSPICVYGDNAVDEMECAASVRDVLQRFQVLREKSKGDKSK